MNLEQYKIQLARKRIELWGAPHHDVVGPVPTNLDKLPSNERKVYQRFAAVELREPNALDGGMVALKIAEVTSKNGELTEVSGWMDDALRKYAYLVETGEAKIQEWDPVKYNIAGFLDARQYLDLKLEFVKMCVTPLELSRLFSPLLSAIAGHIEQIGGVFQIFLRSLMQEVSTPTTSAQLDGTTTQSTSKSGMPSAKPSQEITNS